MNTRELDRQTDALLHVAGVIDRLVTRGERPTRADLDVLDGVYADAEAAGRRPGEALREIARQTGRPLMENQRPPIGVDNWGNDEDSV